MRAEQSSLVRTIIGVMPDSALKKFQEISALLNSTLEEVEIRKRAIAAATVLMDADAGSLLLLDEAAGELYFEVAHGEKGDAVRQIRLKVGQGIAGYVAQTGEPVIVNDVQHDPRFFRSADHKSGFVTKNMVCVPVKARGKLLGVLQAINRKDGGQFDQQDLQNFIALGHQVGIAIENANLYQEIRHLFEGFISASVQAIESRDPTTSGHSGRVALLTCRLAEVVHGVNRGPYASLQFTNDQMKEIRYAALLHDFGKVGVREHVLVKAQKLHPAQHALLTSRFDFIKRTVEVQILRRKVDLLRSGKDENTMTQLSVLDQELTKRTKKLDEMYAFLVRCNQPGGKFQDALGQLREITSLTYQSFDGTQPYLTEDEVTALSLPEGTLTPEERHEIESHVTHTYEFLSKIPWMESLQQVPAIAFAHHERLDGSGYPRGLSGEGIPVQSRMMAICDIYDALAASDRPYKSAVPSQVALGILREKATEGHLDAALLDLFIEAKVYQVTQQPPKTSRAA
jgi:HD-GYP domain-containing protein (c-di-GMP phosphodiesterase class II)